MSEKAQAVADLEYMAGELRIMAEAFRPKSSDRQIVPIPAEMCGRLCDVLLQTADAMKKIVEAS